MNLFTEIEKANSKYDIDLSIRARQIFNAVYDEMQEAEEIEGVEGQDYLNLMNAIVLEASRRIENFLSWHEEENRG